VLPGSGTANATGLGGRPRDFRVASLVASLGQAAAPIRIRHIMEYFHQREYAELEELPPII
jgi:hypothetical protein